jgi:hypothetical protein
MAQLDRAAVPAPEGLPGVAIVGTLRPVEESVVAQGEWIAAADGRWLWRLSLRSPEAKYVRLHLVDFQVGEGNLWIHGTDGRVQEFSGSGLYGDGEFWTGTVDSELVRIEFMDGGGRRIDPLPFRIDQIGHSWEEIKPSPQLGIVPFPKTEAQFSPLAVGTQPKEVAACHLDVACYPDYKTQATGVARMLFNVGTAMASCSGALINSRSGSGRPLFLTADHCISSEAVARTLQTNFFFESASCSPGASVGSRMQTVLGAQYLSSAPIQRGDYALLELLGLPSDPVYFFGWTLAEPAEGTKLTGIHHPAGSHKRITFSTRVPDRGFIVGGDFLDFYGPSDLYYQVNLLQGRAQPGSSGSPLFNERNEIVGTLTSGPTFSLDPAEDEVLLCQKEVVVQYGRFAKAFSTLKEYLDDLRPARIGSPRPGDHLSGARVRFQWSPGIGAAEYRLDVGSSQGGADYFSSLLGRQLSAEVNGLPTDGRRVWVRLWTRLVDEWQFVDVQYLATRGGDPKAARLVSPAPGALLDSTSVTFAWDGGTAVSEYMLDLGSTPDGIDVGRRNTGKQTSVTIENIPADGRILYARVWSRVGADLWLAERAEYRAADLRKLRVTIQISNRLLYPVALKVNEQTIPSAPGGASIRQEVPWAAKLLVNWELIRPTHPSTGVQMGERISGAATVDTTGDVAQVEITNQAGGQTWFSPVITNNSRRDYLLEVNGQRIYHSLAAGEATNWLGYYTLLNSSSVKGYFELLGYSGASSVIGDLAGKAEIGSGRAILEFR